MNRSTLILLSFFVLFATQESFAQLRVANLFSDNMVIQRDLPFTIWGTAKPNGNVSVTINNDDIASTVADEDGRWKLTMNPMPAASKPFSIVVESENEKTIKFNNVVSGDVWICSGQSNMEWTVANSRDPQLEISRADHPLIRHIKIDRLTSTIPNREATNSGWQVCNSQTVGNFTAVGYYFGRKLQQELEVPIGLINSSWGGTIIEAWISGESLKTHPDFKNAVEKIESLPRDDAAKKKLQAQMEKWNSDFNAAMQDQDKSWSRKNVDDSKWKSIEVPGQWEGQGYAGVDGVAWYRRTVDIPAAWAGKEVQLSLAKVDDVDETFVNGVRVGGQSSWDADRKYTIPGDRVSAGPATIAVRVTDGNMGGGIYGDKKELYLSAEGQPKISLAGKWKFRLSPKTEMLGPKPKLKFAGPNNPTVLYNAMIAPLHPFRFKGVIWYQGESNASRAYQYRSLMKLLIEDWRSKWSSPNEKNEFPFYWVQLANFTASSKQPGNSAWAELREAQSMALSVPKTGQAVIIDIGEANDIHPKNKQDVGVRLALNALVKDYGKAVEFSGPVYRDMKKEGNQIRLSFDHADGLTAKGGPLERFEIAGQDKVFVWADAKIEGSEVVVTSPKVQDPVAVRYAWANNPAGCNLYNSAGLPASPFRTDDWQGVTQK